MADINWDQVETIIDQVLTLPEEKRTSFIENKCRGNERLKSEVTLLLNSIFDSEGWLENPQDYKDEVFNDIASDLEQLSSTRDLIGKRIGSYTIKQKIGEGGMGAVFLAERSDGSFDHLVAIKIIRRTQATPKNIERFKQEQNILAGFNHPGIARLYDGGITEEGDPYFIMEYVDGIPLDQYCQKHQCSIFERIALFKQVLEAVGHAHENLVVHRDLKPGNILVNASGKVKILDFGISKLLMEDVSSGSHLTQTSARLLTPKYAAPEQILQSAITTATDLYALGIVFYQLLTDRHPFDLEGLSLFEMEQAILEKNVSRPSTVVSQKERRKKLKGDLDAIALKAIRREPKLRYRVASDFRDDLENFEQELPVSAYEGSFSYRLSKFLKRHKNTVLAAVGMMLLIIGFAFFYTWRITEERNLAQREAKKANEIAGFMIDLFRGNTPGNSKGETLTARQLLERGEKNINKLDRQPTVKARMLEELGNIYSLLSYPDKADSLQQRSLSLKKKLYHSSNPELASIYYSLAATKHTKGEYDKTLGLLDTAISYQHDIFGLQNVEIANSYRLMAETLQDEGKIDSALHLIRKSESIFTNLDATESRDYLRVLKEKGAILVDKGKHRKAENVWREALQLSRTLFDPPHPTILHNIDGLALVMKELSNYKEAEALYSESIRMTKKLYGRMHVNTAVNLNNLGGLYYYTSKYEKADSIYSESSSILKEVLGETHPYVVSNLYNWANLKAEMGKLQEAERLYKKVLALDTEQFGHQHPNVASDMVGLAVLYERKRKFNLAVSYFNQALDIRKKVYNNPHHPYIAYNERSLAQIKETQKQYEIADSLYKKSLNSLIISFGQDHFEAVETAKIYARFLSNQGKDISADSVITLIGQSE